jgi:uncharacterized RDD family membrane protein YckC
MNCPSCGEAVASGRERCPGCGAVVQPPAEGALAPAPSPSDFKTEPLRQIPALQKKDKPTWKDEVRERVRRRRRRRHPEDEALPLFDDPAPKASDARVEEPPPAEAADTAAAESMVDDDLPLNPAAPPGEAQPEAAARAPRTIDLGPEEEEADGDIPEAEDEPWSLGGEGSAAAPPVERPAHLGERFRAGALDAAFLGILAGVVVYFASRRAGVPLAGLKPVWGYLLGYLGFLGLFYATYFTGATGQTLGKLATGLRVADRQGAPPTYSRALMRAALGALGIAVGLAGLAPMLFDPARRAFHDRVFRTRVIRG